MLPVSTVMNLIFLFSTLFLVPLLPFLVQRLSKLPLCSVSVVKNCPSPIFLFLFLFLFFFFSPSYLIFSPSHIPATKNLQTSSLFPVGGKKKKIFLFILYPPLPPHARVKESLNFPCVTCTCYPWLAIKDNRPALVR